MSYRTRRAYDRTSSPAGSSDNTTLAGREWAAVTVAETVAETAVAMAEEVMAEAETAAAMAGAVKVGEGMGEGEGKGGGGGSRARAEGPPRLFWGTETDNMNTYRTKLDTYPQIGHVLPN